jgi:hypothetical protein
LRVSATLPDLELGNSCDLARREVLAWAQKRAGGRLPEDAWNGRSFERLVGGRSVAVAQLETDVGIMWALRGDDPDKTIAGRTWTTEVVLATLPNGGSRLAVRLLASSSEDDLDVEPHVPGFLSQIAANVGMQLDRRPLRPTAAVVDSHAEVDALCELLDDPFRQLPVVVASGDERASDPDKPTADIEVLARALCGLAHVHTLPSRHTFALSDAFGSARSVFHGAIRVYWPGFDASASPYRHPLIIGDRVRAHPAAELKALRQLIADDSVRRRQLAKDIPTFVAVQSAARELERLDAAQRGAPMQKRLRDAEARIVDVERELKQARDDRDWHELLRLEADEARNRESERREALEHQIVRLKAALDRAGGQESDRGALPTTWGVFADWCDAALAGRVVLAAPLRKKLKRALFEEVSLAARCLLWLAEDCLPRRLSGGGGSVEGPLPTDAAIRNTPCGSDTFDFTFHDRKLSADWHIKNGGNTRAPERCLRIYYGFDQSSGQIVIADMPAHRVTGAT